MPREHKRVPGSRRYKDYTDDHELEINYFQRQYGKWVLKDDDLDSRESKDMILVTGYPDMRGYFTFDK